VKSILRLFFRLLYHQFAFTYDLVAAAVSFNHWKDWVLSVVPFIDGDRVLEIGHGPGHLQRVLLSRGLIAVGIDESAQMGHIAKRNLSVEFIQHCTRTFAGPLITTQCNLTFANVTTRRRV
jgi:ubiquinone/menaquinone biosynthesis C-methylase UbiE